MYASFQPSPDHPPCQDDQAAQLFDLIMHKLTGHLTHGVYITLPPSQVMAGSRASAGCYVYVPSPIPT